MTDPWLGQGNTAVPVNESSPCTSIRGMSCAPTGLVFVCGGYHLPRAFECRDGWSTAGLCLLGCLTVPLTVLEKASQEAFMIWELLPLASLVRSSYKWGHDQELFLDTCRHRCLTKLLGLLGQACFWEQDSFWLSFGWARRCLCCGALAVPGVSFWGSWNSVIEDQWPLSLKGWLLQHCFPLIWVLGITALKCTPNIGSFPAFNNHSRLPGTPHPFKSFKCVFVATDQQGNISLRLEPQKSNENDQLRDCEPEVVACKYHRRSAKSSGLTMTTLDKTAKQ